MSINERVSARIELDGQQVNRLSCATLPAHNPCLRHRYASRFSQPTDAATALRNVLLRMQTLGDDLIPAIAGIDKALENLATRQPSTAEITQMFGLHSVNIVMATESGRLLRHCLCRFSIIQGLLKVSISCKYYSAHH